MRALTESKCAHTPGPWIALHDFDGDYGIFPKDQRLTGPIATTYTDREEDRANADLMAAAPVMLAALECAETVLFLLSDEVSKLGCRASAVPEKIKEAISLAKGEL